MDVLDKFLKKVSYKFDKGYPDINNSEDKKRLFEMVSNLTEEEYTTTSTEPEATGPEVKYTTKSKDVSITDIQKLLAKVEKDQAALKKIKQFITNRPAESGFIDSLKAKNITSKTVDTADAPVVMLGILVDNDDLRNYDAMEQPSFSDLGGSGNLVDFFSSKGLSKEALKKIFVFSGKESGRGVGKGEVGMALLFNDLKMAAAGAGDLNWGGKSLEVKGSSARLGGRDRVFPRNFNNTILGELVDEYDISLTQKGGLPVTISTLADKSEVDKNKLLKGVLEFEEIAHPKGDAKKYFTKDILDDPIKLRASFTKNLIQNYTNNHNIDHFIWWNSAKSFGKYVSFSPDEADELVDNGVLRTNNIAIHQLDPSISKP